MVMAKEFHQIQEAAAKAREVEGWHQNIPAKARQMVQNSEWQRRVQDRSQKNAEGPLLNAVWQIDLHFLWHILWRFAWKIFPDVVILV